MLCLALVKNFRIYNYLPIRYITFVKKISRHRTTQVLVPKRMKYRLVCSYFILFKFTDILCKLNVLALRKLVPKHCLLSFLYIFLVIFFRVVYRIIQFIGLYWLGSMWKCLESYADIILKIMASFISNNFFFCGLVYKEF